MKWQKSSPELISRFDACLPKQASVERRQMFGYPCAFVNGNMFTGLHEERLVLRLSEAERERLLQSARASAFEVMGRTMREYVVIADALECAPRELSTLMRKALQYAQGLPPKVRMSKAPAADAGVKPKKRAARRGVR